MICGNWCSGGQDKVSPVVLLLGQEWCWVGRVWRTAGFTTLLLTGDWDWVYIFLVSSVFLITAKSSEGDKAIETQQYVYTDMLKYKMLKVKNSLFFVIFVEQEKKKGWLKSMCQVVNKTAHFLTQTATEISNKSEDAVFLVKLEQQSAPIRHLKCVNRMETKSVQYHSFCGKQYCLWV